MSHNLDKIFPTTFQFCIILNYILLTMLLINKIDLSPNSIHWVVSLLPLLSRSIQQLPPSSGNPPTIVHVHGSYRYKLFVYSFPILYFTDPWLFCNYLFVLLIPSPFHPFIHSPLSSGNHQNTIYINDSICSPCLLFVFYIQLLIDMYLLSFYCS